VSAQTDHPLSLAAWLDRLSGLLPPSAPAVTSAEEAAILDLARIAAHTSVRIAAPISTFLAGMALASLEPQERVAALREVVAQLESPSDV
jgi:Domain of unknown function (DUF6457)